MDSKIVKKSYRVSNDFIDKFELISGEYPELTVSQLFDDMINLYVAHHFLENELASGTIITNAMQLVMKEHANIQCMMHNASIEKIEEIKNEILKSLGNFAK